MTDRLTFLLRQLREELDVIQNRRVATKEDLDAMEKRLLKAITGQPTDTTALVTGSKALEAADTALQAAIDKNKPAK